MEVIKQDLSFDMTCADFDYETVKQTLASQYDIDASLISFDDPCASARRRGRKLAGLSITIEIATPPPDPTGSAPTTSSADILAAMSAVSTTALASSIGSALGTTVSVTKSEPQTVTEERTVTIECPKGKWW